MSGKKLDTIDYEEFQRRLEANNERMRLQIIEMEERMQKWDSLIARKEAFLAHLDQTIAEIEREEAEIAAIEKELPPLNSKGRRQPISPVLH